MSHHGGHGFPRTQQIRAERRKRAEEAQAEYNKKYPTLQAKLDALPATGANKQRARLTAAIKSAQEKAEAARLAAATKAEAKAEKAEKVQKKGKNQ